MGFVGTAVPSLDIVVQAVGPVAVVELETAVCSLAQSVGSTVPFFGNLFVLRTAVPQVESGPERRFEVEPSLPHHLEPAAGRLALNPGPGAAAAAIAGRAAVMESAHPWVYSHHPPDCAAAPAQKVPSGLVVWRVDRQFHGSNLTAKPYPPQRHLQPLPHRPLHQTPASPGLDNLGLVHPALLLKDR